MPHLLFFRNGKKGTEMFTEINAKKNTSLFNGNCCVIASLTTIPAGYSRVMGFTTSGGGGSVNRRAPLLPHGSNIMQHNTCQHIHALSGATLNPLRQMDCLIMVQNDYDYK